MMHLSGLTKISAALMVLFCGNLGANSDVESPAKKFARGNVVKFSTQGHIKAKDAIFSIKYPVGWAAYEGERPNIVQKFVSNNGAGLDMAAISTKRIPGKAPLNKEEIHDVLSATLSGEYLPDGSRLLSSNSTLIEGEPATIMESSRHHKRADQDIYTHMIGLTFIQGRTIVSIQFHSGGLSSDSASIESRFAIMRPLFSLMMNSVIFEDKWK